MFNYPYIIELLSPKRSFEGQEVAKHLNRFADRYQRIIDAGLGLSIPDNPMGQPRWGALESIGRKRLQIDPNRMVMNLNTFHTKNELDEMLEKTATAKMNCPAASRGVSVPKTIGVAHDATFYIPLACLGSEYIFVLPFRYPFCQRC